MGLGQFLQRGFDQIQNPTNSIGQIGKALSQASGTDWGNALTLLDQNKRQGQQDDMQQQIQQAQLQAMQEKQSRNQILQTANGGVVSVDPETNQLTQLRQPDAPQVNPSALESSLKYVLSLPAGSPERQLAERALPNYSSTEPVMQRRIAGQLAVRSSPTYASTHKTTAAAKPPAGFILD